MRRLAEFVLRMRAALVVVLLGAVGWSAYVLPDTEFSLSIVPLIRGSDAERERRTDLATELPIEHVELYCVLTFPRRVDADDVALLGDLGEQLTVDRPAYRVRSLANVPVMQRGWTAPRLFPAAIGQRDVLEVA